MSAILARREDPGKWASATLAALVHGLLAAFLFYGIRWQTHTPDVYEVELVRAPIQIASSRPPPPETKPEPKVEPKVEAKVEPQPAPPPPKPDIAIKEKPTPKPTKTPPPKPAELKLQNKQLQDALQRETARIEASKAEQDLTHRKEEQAAAARSRALNAWSDQINAKIKQKIVRPPNLSGNPEAVFEVNLLPDGSLIGEPRLKKSTGNSLLDSAIERAIMAADPLPKPGDANVFQRTLLLKFRPLED